MAIGIIGRKSGMTRVFAADGESVPVTVIEVEPNRITLIRTPDRDGYHGVQVTTGTRRRTRVTRPQAGHFAAAGVEAGRGVWEFRLADAAPELVVGGDLPLSQFEAGMVVDVTGTSKGKGYAGAIRRWNFRGQDNTHGNSVSHRAPGSIGQCQTPGRVFKGKKMSGHLGAERVTTQRLDIVRVDLERGLLLIRGAVPGAPGGDVIVRPSTKVRAKRAA